MMNLFLVPLLRLLLPKATPHIEPNFRCSEIVILINCSLKRGHFVITEWVTP